MNVWQSMKNFGAAVMAMPEIINPISWASSAAAFTARTFGYAFEQVGALPRLINRILTHAPTRRLARHTAYITLYDVVPQILIAYAMNSIRIGAEQHLLDDDSENSIKNQAIKSALFLMQSAVTVYSYRRSTRRVARQAVLMIEASPSLNKGKAHHFDICNSEQCSGLRQAQGAVRDTVSFIATEIAISATSYVPVAGPYLAPVLRISHLGRYIVSAAMPEVCNRHQVIYHQNNPELTWSFGMTHAALSWLLQSFMHRNLGESPEMDAVIQQNLIFLLTAIAIQMPLSPTRAQSERISVDPIDFLQRSVGAGVDVTLLGLKKYIPRLLRQPGNAIDIAAVDQFFQRHRHDPLVQWMKFIVLDEMLHSLSDFRKDPLVKEHWKGLRSTTRAILSGIQRQEGRWIISATGMAPSLSAKVADLFFGYPKSVVKLLIGLLNNPYFMHKVRQLNQRFAHASDLPAVTQGAHAVVLGRRIPPPLFEGEKKRNRPILTAGSLRESENPESHQRILTQLHSARGATTLSPHNTAPRAPQSSDPLSLLQQLRAVRNGASNPTVFPRPGVPPQDLQQASNDRPVSDAPPLRKGIQ